MSQYIGQSQTVATSTFPYDEMEYTDGNSNQYHAWAICGTAIASAGWWVTKSWIDTRGYLMKRFANGRPTAENVGTDLTTLSYPSN